MVPGQNRQRADGTSHSGGGPCSTGDSPGSRVGLISTGRGEEPSPIGRVRETPTERVSVPPATQRPVVSSGAASRIRTRQARSRYVRNDVKQGGSGGRRGSCGAVGTSVRRTRLSGVVPAAWIPPVTDNWQFRPGTDQPAVPSAVTALASRWSRLGASLIDTLILLVPLVPLTIGPWAPFPSSPMSTVCQQAIQIVYAGALLASSGQTLGMRALNIRVISTTPDNGLTAGQAWLRTAVFSLPPLLPIVGTLWAVVDCGWLLWSDGPNPNRQTLHDKIARTVVVTARPSLRVSADTAEPRQA